MTRYVSDLVVPIDALSRNRLGALPVEHVVEAIAAIAFPVVHELDDAGARIRIEWEAEDDWDLHEKVDEVRVEVEALLNAGLAWDRPTELPS